MAKEDKDRDLDDADDEKEVVAGVADGDKPRWVWTMPCHARPGLVADHNPRWHLFRPSTPPPVPESIDDAKEIPLATASWFSRMVMAWMDPLMTVGFKRPLQSADLWKMDKSRQGG